MNSQAIAIFDNLLQVEVSKLIEKFDQDAMNKVNEANSRGMLRSSAAAMMLVEVTKNTETILTNITFGQLLRCYSAAEITVGMQNTAEIKSIIRESVHSHSEKFRQKLFSLQPLKGEPSLLPIAEVNKQLDEAKERELSRVEAEIDLIALRNASIKDEAKEAASSFVFNAPVAQVISGSHNSGTANQWIDGSSAKELVECLDNVLILLDTKNSSSEETKLAEIAVEAKTEIQKDSINVAKVEGLISVLNKGLATIPKAHETYEVLSRALNGLGWDGG